MKNTVGKIEVDSGVLCDLDVEAIVVVLVVVDTGCPVVELTHELRFALKSTGLFIGSVMLSKSEKRPRCILNLDPTFDCSCGCFENCRKRV